MNGYCEHKDRFCSFAEGKDGVCRINSDGTDQDVNDITHINIYDRHWFSDEDLRNFGIRKEDIHPLFEFNNSQIAFRLLFDREVKGFGHGYYVEIIGFVRNGEKYGKI